MSPGCSRSVCFIHEKYEKHQNYRVSQKSLFLPRHVFGIFDNMKVNRNCRKICTIENHMYSKDVLWDTRYNTIEYEDFKLYKRQDVPIRLDLWKSVQIWSSPWISSHSTIISSSTSSSTKPPSASSSEVKRALSTDSYCCNCSKENPFASARSISSSASRFAKSRFAALMRVSGWMYWNLQKSSP